MTTNAPNSDGMDAMDMLETLTFKVDRRRRTGGGQWVSGTIAGHEFEALVFPEPAENPDWEVNGDSRISKLWLQRISDKAEVYNWDRGEDRQPATDVASQIVDLLAAGLAEAVFGS